MSMKKKLAAIFMTLAMVLAMIPQMPRVAASANSLVSGLNNNDKVWFGGKVWHVLNDNITANESTGALGILLITEELQVPRFFHHASFPEEYTAQQRWDNSDARAYLQNVFPYSLSMTTAENAAVMTAVKSENSGNNPVGLTGDKFFLLSENEALQYKDAIGTGKYKNIEKCHSWTRSTSGKNMGRQASCNFNGNVGDWEVYNCYKHIPRSYYRPAFYLDPTAIQSVSTGSDGIKVLTFTDGTKSSDQSELSDKKIWFGGKLWRVLETDTLANDNTKTKGILLISEYLLGNHKWNDVGPQEMGTDGSYRAVWDNSEIRRYLKNDFEDTLKMSEKEKNSVLTAVKEDGPDLSEYSHKNANGYEVGLTGDRFFLLNQKQVYFDYFPVNAERGAAYENGDGSLHEWWIRSVTFTLEYPCFASMKDGGYGVPTLTEGVRPSFYLDPSDISSIEEGPRGGYVITFTDGTKSTCPIDMAAISGAGEGIHVNATPDLAFAGDTVLLSLNTDTLGYEIGNVNIKDGTGNDIPVTKVTGTGNIYSFVLPGSGISTVTASKTLVWTDNGTGTEDDPYKIKNARDWNIIAAYVEAGGDTSNKYFELENDITITKPLGTVIGGKNRYFKGCFDGAGHTLTVDLEGTAEGLAPFSMICNAAIRHLKVKGTVSGARYCAGLVGHCYEDNTISDCLVSTDIICSDQLCGGIVGRGVTPQSGYSTTIVEGCVFCGSITGREDQSTDAGAIWGYNDPSVKVTIRRCLVDGTYRNVNISPSGMGSVFYDIMNIYCNTDIVGTPSVPWNLNTSKKYYTVLADTGCSMKILNGISYSTSGITAGAKGLEFGGKIYALPEEEISVALAEPGNGTYIPSEGTLTGQGTEYTLTMPDKDLTIYLIVAPTAKNDLKYDGNKHKLIDPGSAVGGEMQYALGDENGAAEPYAVTVPEAVESGDYTVWYKVAGNTDDMDSSPVAIAVSISKIQNVSNAPESEMNVSFTCEKVSGITLPTGWSWNSSDADKTLTVGTAVTATAVYNGTDKDNYVNTSISISITRSACTHQGGTATCKDKAVCEICGEEYGSLDPDNHTGDTEISGKADPTCTKDGYTGDIICKDCGETITPGTVEKATGHKFGTPIYTLSEDKKTCNAVVSCTNEGCTEIVTETVNVTSKVKTEATTGRKGTTTYIAVFTNSDIFTTQSWDIEDIPMKQSNSTSDNNGSSGNGSTTTIGDNTGKDNKDSASGDNKTENTNIPEPTLTKNEDGSTTETTVKENSDGSTTKTEVTTGTDGSSAEKETTIGKDGITTVKETTAESDGTVTVKETVIQKDGSSKSEETSTETDGTTTVKETVTNKDGSSESYATISDADGNVTATVTETVQENKRGTVIVTTTTENADGSKTESTEKTTKAGKVVTETVTTDPEGNTVESNVTKNTDGSTEFTSKTTNADGSTEVTSGTENTDGSSLVMTVKTDAEENATIVIESLNADGKKESIEYAVDKPATGKGKKNAGKVSIDKIEAKLTTETIPDTIKVDGKTYKITSIGDNALADNNKVKHLAVGKYVKSIGENAFANAKKLKDIQIYGNIKEIGEGAFLGIAKKAVITIHADEKTFEKIVKLIKASGVGKKVKFVRAD